MSKLSDLQLATHLADVADRLSVPAFDSRDFQVEYKPDGSPVTTTDKAIESALRGVLTRERPGDRIVGEEFGGESGTGRCWYLDPIDGTANFVSGRDAWGTLISLAQGRRVLATVVAVPTLGRRLWASRGSGAFADGNPLRVSRTCRLADASVCVGPRGGPAGALPGGDADGWVDRCREVRPYLGGESMIAVASGEADVAIGSGGGPWDYAPFALLVEEAGGKTSDLGGQARFDSGSLLATNGLLHGEALDALNTEVR